MKIICLTKRRPLGRDLWERPYGRFYYLTKGLAEKGHQVHLVLANYKKEDEFSITRDGFRWHSVNVNPNPFNYHRYVKNLAVEENADLMIGFSDIYFGILAEKISSQIGCLSLIDAYDNYESYLSWCKPLHWIWRRALNKASGITAAGPELLAKLCGDRTKKTGSEMVIPMCADPVFFPRDKTKSRESFGIPKDKFVIGYSGSISNKRDINILIDVLQRIYKSHPNVINIFSGHNKNNKKFPPNTHWLGYIDDEMMPELFSSFDVSLSMNKNSAFGNYSYPIKIYESLACGASVLASRTMSTEYVLEECAQALFDAEDVDALHKKLLKFLKEPFHYSLSKDSWTQRSDELHVLISYLARNNSFK